MRVCMCLCEMKSIGCVCYILQGVLVQVLWSLQQEPFEMALCCTATFHYVALLRSIMLHGYVPLCCTATFHYVARLRSIMLHGYVPLCCMATFHYVARLHSIMLHGYVPLCRVLCVNWLVLLSTE